MLELLQPFFSVFSIFFRIIGLTWWFLVPFLLFLLFRDIWLFYVYQVYEKSIQWTILEIKVPKEISKTPKAMEQVFAAVSATYPDIKFLDKWWRGVFPARISFELVGYAGGVYFFIRLPTHYKNTIEAAIYAQYPGAEIKEASDYVELMPAVLPNAAYDIMGMDFVLSKEDAYPLRTYEYFEDIEDERRIDPIAAVTEVMSKLKEGESIWLQLIVEVPMYDWKKKAESVINKLIGAEAKSSSGIIAGIFSIFHEIFSPSAAPADKKPDQPNKLQYLTANQKDVVKAIEEKISKLGYHTTFRFIYIDNRDRFTRANVSAIIGSISQFNTLHLNSLRPYSATYPKGRWPFKESMRLSRKKFLYQNYRDRLFASKKYILNTEELATIYHFPTLVVEAPRLQRIEAKKSEPPPNLPIG